MDFDLVFGTVDEFGPYQKFHTALLLFSNMFMNAFNVFGLVFLTYTPKFWCAEDDNLTFPYDTGPEVIIPAPGDGFTPSNESMVVKIPGELIASDPCNCPSNQWIYSDQYMKSTIVTQWDLVCDQAVVPKIMINCLYAAAAVGAIALSIVQDKIGRKPSILVFISLILLGNVFAPVIPIFGVYAAFRALSGLTAQGVFNHGYVWTIEFVGPSKRTLVTVIAFAFYGAAVTSIALIAYVFNSWKHLSLIFSVPFVGAISYYWILSESPRWLIQQGRQDEAVEVVERLLRWQGPEPGSKPASKEELRRLLSGDKDEVYSNGTAVGEQAGGGGLWKRMTGLFQTPNLRYKSIIICLCRMISNTTYIGIAFNTENLAENIFIMFAAQAAMEIPAVVCNIFLLERFGRILPVSGFFWLTGIICCLTAPASHLGITWLVVTLSAVGKFCICLSNAIVEQTEAEIFPTEYRATGKGFACFFASVGNMVMPFIVHSSRVYKTLPMVLLGCLGFIGGLLSIQLPETKGTILPETAEEAEVRGIAGMRTALATISRACSLKKPEESIVKFEENESLQCSDGAVL